ncbi:MAG: hypothetical protein RIC16_16655 [Rhodospirillales bacterium]
MVPFSQDGYRELLSGFAGLGYTPTGYDAVEPDARQLILRHDLDFSLEAALPIARIEREQGWTAHYFVLVRGDFYNCLGETAHETIAEIQALGHRVGLHLDGALYGNDVAEVEAGARNELAALEAVAGRRIDVISFHRPAEQLIGLPQPLAERLHTYMPRFFDEIGYCSDSQGSWRFQAPLDHEAVTAGRAMQLLTHPIWWPETPMTDPTARLEAFVEERGQRLRDGLEKNCRSYVRKA